MSSPVPISTGPAATRGSAPAAIEPVLYPGLADLRPHCASNGVALIDRAYRDALALHKRATEAEARVKDLMNELENAWAEADMARTGGEDLL